MKETKEIWEDIPGYDGLYQVSDQGRVKSLDRTVINKFGNPRTIKGAILTLKNSNGYKRIQLYKNGGYEFPGVHRLVMLAFEGPSDLVVDHINNNPSDNRLVNLRYLTHRDNISRGMKNKTSQFTGVYMDTSKGMWRAHLRVNSIGYCLGQYKSEEEAKDKYEEALKNLLDHNILPERIKRTKVVIDLASGVFYDSLKEAAEVYRINARNLSAMLLGKRKNRTLLTYC